MAKYWQQKIGWSLSGVGSYTDLGEVHSDTAHNPATAQEETSSGKELYAGLQDVYECKFYDETKYAALRTEMLADNLVDLQFTDAEGNTEAELGFSVIVMKQKSFNPRTRQAFTARFVKSSI